eukprot:gb/GEZN01010448.1/.p1 GENE.gb/GEZN01010448.1/~~gb/GEZN01010448.1/.p1  ORF type:complete len:399 (+),score=30.97 gb/GEZN01010448.1/:35-1198(+)
MRTSWCASRAFSSPSSAPAVGLRPRPTKIFSGIQPTGCVTLGNYLGAISNWVDLQARHSPQSSNSERRRNIMFCIVDLHALTSTPDPRSLRADCLNMVATLLACGIDPAKCSLFVQSWVPQHAELAWILNCLTPLPWLSRMTQYKDKLVKEGGNPTVEQGLTDAKLRLGLFSYPVLMAADILLYRADEVPVGEDQHQHVELARQIVKKFNNQYKVQLFRSPQALEGPVRRVMSLRDGRIKMSKSDVSDMSRINLTDDPDLIAKKIKKAKTDGISLLTIEEDRPEIKNLLSIHSALSHVSPEQLCIDFNALGETSKVHLKESLTQLLVEKLDPIRTELARLHKDRTYLNEVLLQGYQNASLVAEDTMENVRDVVGLLARHKRRKTPYR